MSDDPVAGRRRKEDMDRAEAGLPIELLKTPTKKDDATSSGEEAVDPDIDVVGSGDDEEHEMVMPAVTSSGEVLRNDSEHTPTKAAPQRNREAPETSRAAEEDEEEDPLNVERVFSSFPCQVIPETLSRLTRTPPDGEHLEVHKNKNGRLRIYVIDHFKKFSSYSNMTHKPCTVCNQMMKAGEMHLNFPADLDRRRIWANLLGFKYKDILRSKMGPVSFSIASGPICTEHFAEECFRNHNFNKAAIEAFGVPVAISPDVKTTPSKKSSRVPWVCTICDFHSCSVVELQLHLLDHTEKMMKKKDGVCEVPEAGFMCPFCRKCTYGYKTISGYRRHLNAAPVHHCHLRRIYEFAKMNCRASELEPIEKWDNWTRRNVYVAYHGCEPPANEVVLTPSPTKSVCNPEERTRQVHDDDTRRKAVRSLAFVGKEGGTSVNDYNVMQRAVYLQIRRNIEHLKRYPGLEQLEEDRPVEETPKEASAEPEVEEEEEEEEVEEEKKSSPQEPMGVETRKSRRLAAFVTASPVKRATRSLPTTPAKKKRKLSSEEPEVEEEEETPTPDEAEEEPEPDRKEKLRQAKIRDEQFAKMVAKRSQQVKRLISAKQLKNETGRKPRKALAMSSLVKKDDEEQEVEEQTPEPVPQVSEKTPKKKEEPVTVKKEEERPLKSMLARSFAAGVRPSMAKYQMPMEAFSSGSSAPAGPAVPKKVSQVPAGLFARVLGVGAEKGPAKRPTLLSRRPIILSPRKRAPSHHPITHHESSPNLSMDEPNQLLIPGKEMTVELVEEVVEDTPEEDVPTSSGGEPKQTMMTLAEALELKNSAPVGSTVKDQEFDEISKEMMKDSQYYRAMEDAIKCRTVTKMRADMRLSRHCIRQIEAARARARLFGEASEDQYQIYYSNEGAQVVTKNDPKWIDMQQQQQQQHQHTDDEERQ